jgi:predicted small secreted protein
MKRVYLFTLLCVVFALLLTGCGGGNSTTQVSTGAGQVVVQTGDAVNDQIAKFELNISSITLTGVSPTATTANLLAKPAEVEFSHEAGTFEPLTLANLPPGTYNGATITVTGAEVVVLNAGVPTKVQANISSGTVSVTFANITVTSTPLFLNFDLDLAASVVLNGTPITSATINPTFTVTSAATPPAGNEGNEDHNDGEMDDVHGSVKSISAPNFTITTNSTDITFATDANTRFKDGITQLSDLKVGDIVEVDAITKSDGTKLATKVERESSQNGEEVEGLISALDNPLATITVIHQMDSTGTSNSPVTVPVGVNSSTVYSVRSDKLNITAPAFDATHIGKGQRIEADSSTNVTPLLATKVKLREQALIGTVAASPAPTTSGFTITISPTSAFGTLSGATSVAVTFANGATLKTTPVAGATIRARGLVFFNAGTYSMIAVRDDDNH